MAEIVSAPAACQWTLKVEFESELRRLKHWPEDDYEPSFSAVQSSVARLFNLAWEEVEALTLRYQDDKGNMCTLDEATLPDALALSSAKFSQVLRIFGTREAAPIVEHAQMPAHAEVSSSQAEDAFRRLAQHLQEEVRTTIAELKSAVTEPGGLRLYSTKLQGRLGDRVVEAHAAAAEARAAAVDAYSQAQQGDVKAALGLAAAAVVPAVVLALAPGRCTRLGLLAAGTLAVAKLCAARPTRERQGGRGVGASAGVMVRE
mmetsp:Transcript_40183/g.111675  ORF Transcript_40183/g.111675 Transcript_40183/m.111675 type:complete len:260 (-) Transcript_40183:44-823(-)